ncbi:MAG: TIGR01458 family HAD-type hydrolase [Gammaproteobacteria bacterium]|nr:TIGR01458 family HAD-type hydrolase [Gammaproteobacteria bacterium]MBI5615038.1 TIGR01458 family HAD-type hydrolase [Gammaproteobacteria bacterium]
MIRGVLCDLVGVLYEGHTVQPGAHAALAALERAGLVVRYLTNTTRSPCTAILARLQALGFRVGPEALFTAPRAVHDHLLARGLEPLLITHPDLAPEFADLPPTGRRCVVIGDPGEAADYASLNAAFRLLKSGAPLIAMGRNRYFQEDGALSLDMGPFVALLEYAAEIEACVLGKPAPAFFEAALAGTGLAPHETVMIGDDVEADVLGAVAAGMRGILVRTGKYRAGDERRLGRGALCVADVGEAVREILTARDTR